VILFVVLLVTIGALIGTSLIRKSAKKGKTELDNQLLQLVSETNSTNLLLVLDKYTGLSIFEHKFQEFNVDPQLIAGIFQAYSAFDREISGDNAARASEGLYNLTIIFCQENQSQISPRISRNSERGLPKISKMQIPKPLLNSLILRSKKMKLTIKLIGFSMGG
jgi:hypothetical protein